MWCGSTPSASASLSLPAIAPFGAIAPDSNTDAPAPIAHGDVQPRAARRITRRQLVAGEVPHADIRDQPVRPTRSARSIDSSAVDF